ncbi:MAG: bifunctional diaminohydroxyphosphoribosylaminopyrimidine deaminase/5-amino-6-(5-phosphoribosylamino)uracil reductase RibD [Gemmatimonadaceae bacterium]|nr:bifunctional diaminohydroxyphosphoribosylaminopyrimidine deaminase/5-amino-6-(5-phosphoribosylamino)uracil reductase RibD [Gemmatimonadaceae bacterium]
MSAFSTDDRRFMRRALGVALRGRGTTAPNPMVGAVVVREGRVVGEGHTQPPGGAHAEIMALAAAGEAARGATVYVTLEPCNGTGRTPPCVDALLAAGVARVVYAATDPNPAMQGGAERLATAGVRAEGGLEAQAALDQNPAFFHRFASGRPFVTLKLALSLDGAIAGADRSRTWLTGPAARREVHRQRRDHAAVAVGVGTAIADDPLLTVRGLPTPQGAPVRVIFDRHGRLPCTGALVRSAREIPVIVACLPGSSPALSALAEAGVSLLPAPDLPSQLAALRAAGVESIYCEGGAALADALLADGLVDRLVIFTAPVLLGADAVRPLQAGVHIPQDATVRHRLVAQRRFGDDLMAIYDLSRSVHRTR